MPYRSGPAHSWSPEKMNFNEPRLGLCSGRWNGTKWEREFKACKQPWLT